MRRLIYAVVGIALTLGLAQVALAAEIPSYVPSDTQVVILPVINLTGEKWAKLRESQTNVGYNEVKCLFAERGFQVLDYAKVQAAVEELGVNLSDEEEHSKETVRRVGEKADGKIAVLLVITDTTQRTKMSFFTSQIEGNAKIKMWVIHVPNGTSLLKGKQFDAKRVSGSFGRGAKGSALQVDAVRRASQTALDDFLKPYKVVKEVKRQDVNPSTGVVSSDEEAAAPADGATKNAGTSKDTSIKSGE